MSSNARFSVFAKIEQSPNVAVEGRVFTKSHIVALILDLVGYTSDRELSSLRLLDPGCGEGAFIGEAARRLLTSLKNSGRVSDLGNCLLGVEKDLELGEECREKLYQMLTAAGLKSHLARSLASQWVVCDDFLTRRFDGHFDFVVGNPPYVRQEAIPKDALTHYRERFSCFYDRADLYVAFIERGLELLGEQGALGFICPDRFMRNNYGKKLRKLITESFHVRQIVDLSRASPFEPEVCCYPGIFVIGKGEREQVDYFRLSEASEDECEQTRKLLAKGTSQTADGVTYHRYERWFTGEEPWAVASPAHTELLRRLELSGSPLGSPSSGTTVGIGVATGADSVFIVTPEESEVEPELLLPLAMTKDVESGHVNWTRQCVINPFASEDSDALIDLRAYPRAGKYFLAHEDRLRERNVGKRNPERWYRTIDRIYPSLRRRAKLLIPDIKANNVVAFECGDLYPHHNLYYVTSDYWDLKALRTILRSSVAKFFVWMYGVKMRAGFLRFQAQYLRKIGLPPLIALRADVLSRLKSLDAEQDLEAIDGAVAKAYSLSRKDLDLIHDVTQSL